MTPAICWRYSRCHAERVRLPLCGDVAHREDGLREGKRLWAERLAKQFHFRLLGGASAFVGIALYARRYDVIPNGFTALNAWNDVVVIQFVHGKTIAAVLAAELIAAHDIYPRKLNAFLECADGLQEFRNGGHLHRDAAIGVRVDDLFVPVENFDFAGEEFRDGVLPRADSVGNHVVIEDECGGGRHDELVVEVVELLKIEFSHTAYQTMPVNQTIQFR